MMLSGEKPLIAASHSLQLEVKAGFLIEAAASMECLPGTAVKQTVHLEDSDPYESMQVEQYRLGCQVALHLDPPYASCSSECDLMITS